MQKNCRISVTELFLYPSGAAGRLLAHIVVHAAEKERGFQAVDAFLPLCSGKRQCVET